MLKKNSVGINYKKSLSLSLGFSIICLVLFYCTGYIYLPEIIESYMVYCLLVICPIPFLILWIITLVRYLAMEYGKLGEQDCFWRRLSIFFSVIPIICFCVVFFYHLEDFVDYLTYRWSYMDKLLDCLGIKLSLTVGWFFCWIFSIKKKRVIAFKGNIRQKLVLLLGCVLMCWLLSYISIASKAYIYERTEDAWYENMVEVEGQ